MSQLITSDDQSIGASVSAPALPISIQGLIFLIWTGLLSLLSKGLSGVFCSSVVQKHQLFNLPKKSKRLSTAK